jgi:deoxyribose-phosphate aldolase
MALRLEELAKTIDHTLLDASATEADVDRLCDEALLYHFACVCVRPEHVGRAAERLRGHDVKVSAAVGLPAGDRPAKAKVELALRCVDEGADELDLLVNGPALAEGDFLLVRDELVGVERALRMKSVNAGRGAVLLKVVVDPSLVGDKAKRLTCKIIESSGADFASVVTGPDGIAGGFHEVELIREYLSERVGVKASGGFATAAEALALVNAGAGRIGTPSAVSVMGGPAAAPVKG